jgi:tetratricopeptide (TPR) repeat protein
MLRMLFFFVRHCMLVLRDAAYTLRSWLIEWFFVLTTPIRAFRPRAWLAHLYLGIMEVLAMLRLARPQGFRSELVGGGFEIVGIVRGFVGGVVATAVGFFWLLVWLPWFLARFFYHAPIELWYFLRTRSRRQLAYISGFMIVFFVGLSGIPIYLFREHRRNTHLNFLQRQVEGYVLYTSDVDKLENSLVALGAATPNDPSIEQRLEMVRKREAQPSEPNLVRFFMRYHMNNGDVDASVREANKLLESFPDDWEARCELANAALKRGDVSGARKQVAALPHAGGASAPMLADVALNSAHLFKRIGDESRYDEMVDFVTNQILPRLREKVMVHEPIPNKWFLINCYYLSLARLEKRPWLQKYWASLEAASQSIMDDPNVDAPMLVQLGQSGQKVNLRILEVFLAQQRISHEEYMAKSRDLLARQKVLWEKTIRLDPKLAGGYVGMAELLYMTGAPAAAEQIVADGLRECGNTPDMVVAAAKLYRLTDPRQGLAFLDRTLRDQDMTPLMSSVYDEVACQAGRPDRALVVCRLALEKDSKQVWARLRIANLCLALGRPGEAVAALSPIEDDLSKYPDSCSDYVRALCDCGAYQQVSEFLESVTAADCSVVVLLKTADGLQAAGRHADAVRWARRALEIEALNVDAFMCVADNTRILADRGEKGWDIDLVREALAAYRTVVEQQPNKAVAYRAANNIAWLELKALHLPQEAFASAAPLRVIQNTVDIKAEYLETLGAVYIGVHQFDQAREMLIQAIRTSGERPSFYMHLALAYNGLGQSSQASWCLSKAAEMPGKTPKDMAELREVSRTINGQ